MDCASCICRLMNKWMKLRMDRYADFCLMDRRLLARLVQKSQLQRENWNGIIITTYIGGSGMGCGAGIEL
jgi:hypothetical protein